MKIYTKTGDKGETSLFGGDRVSKDNLRISAYGTIDELNSVLGMSVSLLDNQELITDLQLIQNQLFTLGSDLATPLTRVKAKTKRIRESDINLVENRIDFYEKELPELRNFILPGGNKPASILHFARTVCRRAEREIVMLMKQENIGDNILKYVNRLSDLLFILARYANFISETRETEWKP